LAADFDGTLAPIVPDPRDAWPPPLTVSLLDRLCARLRCVAVLSGRDVAALAERLPVAGLTLVGNYGWEYRRGSEEWVLPAAASWREPVREATRALVEDPRLRGQGVLVEGKALSISVHFRTAPEPLPTGLRLQPAVEAVGRRFGLRVHAGRLVWELRPPVDVDKGQALTALLAEQRPAAAIYAGDDLGDRPAWAALRRFGGIPLAVGVASSEAPAELFADCDLLLDGPTELQRFLGLLAEHFTPLAL
jgi:trehalose 6-phosphate phosphatase